MAITVLPYLSPRLIVVNAPDTEITIQQLVDQVRDWEDSPEGMTYEKLISAAGKENLGGGVSVGITATLENAQLYFEERSTPLVASETVSTADSTGKTCIAVGATFQTDSVGRGDIIYNQTTGAMATVLSVDSETQITHLPLSGGSRADWQISDNVVVYNQVQCNISGGNLVAVDDVGADLSPVLESPLTQVVRTSSSSATLQDLESVQAASFDGGVAVNVSSSYSGTEFPVGTREQPVNNMADALTIAQNRGFNTFYVSGALTLSSGDFSAGYVFHGENVVTAVITVQAASDVNSCEFIHATIDGTIDNNNIFRECIVGDVTQLNGYLISSVLTGTVTLGGGLQANIINCYSGIAGGGAGQYPVVDMGGTGQTLVLRNYSGGIGIENCTGAGDSSLDFASGRAVFENTVTAGTFTVRGIAEITDNSGGTAVVSDKTLDQDIWNHIIEGSTTAKESMRLQNAALLSKLSGAETTTVRIRDLADTKDRVVATVDSNGNRTAVTLDGS